jgi:hypothetical protein
MSKRHAVVHPGHASWPTAVISTAERAQKMADARCSCGFVEIPGADETIGDHLFEAFAPDDGKGPDGKVHLEGEVALYCLCGAGGSAPELDAHWLEFFTLADSVGRDGVRHERSGRFRL